MLEKSLFGSLPEGLTTGLEEWDEMRSGSRDGVHWIFGERQHVVGEHLQHVGVSAAGCERCSDLVWHQTGFQKFPRFALKQDRKGRGPKISGPSLVQNKIVP